VTELMTEAGAPRQKKETRSAVERIAAFAATARPDGLTPAIRLLYKRNILDSLGGAIAALPVVPKTRGGI
jgi:hypothetical protein